MTITYVETQSWLQYENEEVIFLSKITMTSFKAVMF